MNVETSLNIHGAQGPGGNFAPADFDCVNKPLYNCTERVDRAGARCSECLVRTSAYSVPEIHSEYELWRNA